MTPHLFTFELSPNEERLAQILTRDAWTYFSELISQRDLFHVKEIPMMPRHGVFEMANDAEIAQYYVDQASEHQEELRIRGWSDEQIADTVGSFIAKIENVTGILRGAFGLNAKITA